MAASHMHVRVFLDQGASCSFVKERLAQQVKLPRRRDNSVIAGIAGVNATRTRGDVSFTVSQMSGKGRHVYVENAFVLSKVCMDMPVSPVAPIVQWRHLTGLDLADPDFETPARIDVLLGSEYCGETLLRGRRWGPRGTPYAQRTYFKWFLAGPLQSKDTRPAAYTCCVHLEKDTSRRFLEIEDNNMKNSVLFLKEKRVVEHFESSYSKGPSSLQYESNRIHVRFELIRNNPDQFGLGGFYTSLSLLETKSISRHYSLISGDERASPVVFVWKRCIVHNF